MDPLAHTLVGATLAETGLRRKSPLATATLLLGANAPDIDIVVAALGNDATLLHRRGMTHGVLAMAVLPLVLTGLMLGYDRWARRRSPSRPAPRARVLLGLAYLSVWTHPALDYLNTYGVRLLMPFDARWFRGDTLSIVDPWMWLLMAAAVVLARSSDKKSAAWWTVLGAATTAVVTGTTVGLAIRVFWFVGLGAIVLARLRGVLQESVRRLARWCLGLLVAYIGLSMLGSNRAEQRVHQWFRGQGLVADDVLVTPGRANPFDREVVAKVGEQYFFARFNWFSTPQLTLTDAPVPVGMTPVVRSALDHPSVAGFRNWARFPSYEVRTTPQGYEVMLRDMRYVRREDNARFGTALVRVDGPAAPVNAR